MRRFQTSLVGLMLCASVPLGRAEPWWVSYEGDVFPETLPGWTRVHGSIPAQRWIEDGSLFIDSRENMTIYDFYEMTFDHPIDPQAPQEQFYLSWSLKVHEQVGNGGDPGIGVTSDAARPNVFYSVGFVFYEDHLRSGFEGVEVGFVPGVFHDYNLTSTDMRSYELSIDGTLALIGTFAEVFGPSRVGWGDSVYGGSSLAEWDWVRFGVAVPEMGAAMLFGALLVAFAHGRRLGR